MILLIISLICIMIIMMIMIIIMLSPGGWWMGGVANMWGVWTKCPEITRRRLCNARLIIRDRSSDTFPETR